MSEGSVHVREVFKVVLLEEVLGHRQHQAHVHLGLLALREASAQHQHLVLRQSAAQAGQQAPVAHTQKPITSQALKPELIECNYLISYRCAGGGAALSFRSVKSLQYVLLQRWVRCTYRLYYCT